MDELRIRFILDWIIFTSWASAFVIFMITKDYAPAGVLVGLGTLFAIKEAICPTKYG